MAAAHNTIKCPSFLNIQQNKYSMHIIHRRHTSAIQIQSWYVLRKVSATKKIRLIFSANISICARNYVPNKKYICAELNEKIKSWMGNNKKEYNIYTHKCHALCTDWANALFLWRISCALSRRNQLVFIACICILFYYYLSDSLACDGVRCAFVWCACVCVCLEKNKYI